ncbi:hypothetical protein SeMB42_g04955 [Synchytrium endobioticum]|uniref:RING-type domain-containing protein n=1 Tax=Synchytrium endobioticum TaxID=286115 RepID=A0A507CUN2_9FUNG|nr:hypothetical protein SeMB42_g04955 [Synchytrium endobioticum]
MNRTKVIALVILQLTACPINGVTAWPGDDLVRSSEASQRGTSSYSSRYEQDRRGVQRAQNVEHAFAARPNPSIMTYWPQDDMHAHRQEEDAGASSRHAIEGQEGRAVSVGNADSANPTSHDQNTMAQSRFQTVSKSIERMFNAVNEFLDSDDWIRTEPLRDIVSNLQGMWTTIKSKSEDDMSQALDKFAQKLEIARLNVYTEWTCDIELHDYVRDTLNRCFWALKGHKSRYDSWEDHPVCSKCKGEVWVGERKKLSCNHFFYRECSPKSGQPCTSCATEERTKGVESVEMGDTSGTPRTPGVAETLFERTFDDARRDEPHIGSDDMDDEYDYSKKYDDYDEQY